MGPSFYFILFFQEKERSRIRSQQFIFCAGLGTSFGVPAIYVNIKKLRDIFCPLETDYNLRTMFPAAWERERFAFSGLKCFFSGEFSAGVEALESYL